MLPKVGVRPIVMTGMRGPRLHGAFTFTTVLLGVGQVVAAVVLPRRITPHGRPAAEPVARPADGTA